MATIDCPHCGKEVFEGLDACPHCGGPITAEMIEEANQELIKDIEDATRRASRKSLVWFIVSTAIAFLFALLISSGMAEDFSGIGKVGAYIGYCVAFTYFLGSLVFGIYSFKPIRRWGFGVFLFSIGIFIAILVGWIGGMFFWYPRAISRLIRRKPLVSEKEMFELAEKGWI